MSKPKRPNRRTRRGFKQKKRKYCSCGMMFPSNSAKANKAGLQRHLEENPHHKQVPFAEWALTV